jgi:hypothetical protein
MDEESERTTDDGRFRTSTMDREKRAIHRMNVIVIVFVIVFVFVFVVPSRKDRSRECHRYSVE